MKIDYETLEAEIVYQTEEVIVYTWNCNIGFGQLVIDAKNGEILDDEYMGKEFCEQVIKIAKENKNER